MNIGIIGAGNVGGALGQSWVKAGHQVKFGVRNAGDQKVKDLLAKCGANASAGANAEAAAFGEVVAFSTPWEGTQAAVAACGNLAGKTVIDCTNPLKFTPGKGLELVLGFTTSAGEQVAGWAKGAKVVKAFNTYGFENFADASYPAYGKLKPVMFIAGDDAGAKRTVAQLASDVGFEPLDTGPLSMARYLEPTAMLWIQLANTQKLGSGFTWGWLRR